VTVDLRSYQVDLPDGHCEMTFAVDHVTCGGCAAKIEREFSALPGVDSVRVNLTDKRLLLRWCDGLFDPANVPEKLRSLGYDGRPFRGSDCSLQAAATQRALLTYLAVAGFGAMNIMLLSISVWSGNASDISTETRDLFHWVSALIVLPVAVYAGQPFYRSAWRALRSGHVNMDVPISLGVGLALILSVYETAHSGRHAYFDSAVMLLFFLLAGRTLDAVMQARAHKLTANLLALRGQTARRLSVDGSVTDVLVEALRPGERILVPQGERIGADGFVESGKGEIDQSLITGETRPVDISPGARIYAGALNLGAALTIRVDRAGQSDLIEEIEQLRNRALAVKDRRLVLADHAARYYAPFVHSAALITFLGWWIFGASVHAAAVTAISVLIITCPCALALAIPAVHVAATSALMRKGLLLQEGDALERIAACDTIVFDKTGTLTRLEMSLCNGDEIVPESLANARRLAVASHHPVANSLARDCHGLEPFHGTEEIAGMGVRTVVEGKEMRLGSPSFTGVAEMAGQALVKFPGATVLGYRHGEKKAVLVMMQRLRDDAINVVASLQKLGLDLRIFSGDNSCAVSSVARKLNVGEWSANMSPMAKTAALEALAGDGRKVLMIGDGVNDAPALASAHASIAPAEASHIAQVSADVLFLGQGLAPVADAVVKARFAQKLMKQNLWFAAAYNVLAVPLAVCGLVTPLIAAAAMSFSSIIVSLNATRAAATDRPGDNGIEPASLIPAVSKLPMSAGGRVS
jgi:Cu2+-exporting ATPase